MAANMKSRIGITGALVLAGAMLSGQSLAGSAKWSSTNIQYLSGSGYENPFSGEDYNASIITLEHVNGWKYGDNFFFVDITNPDTNDVDTPTSFYGEISPRLSFSKMTGADLSFGIVKDVLLTFTAEEGQGFHTYLYGVAVDLAVPKVPVLQVNYYVRDDQTFDSDTGSQLTLVWVVPFATGPVSWTFEGFADYAWGVDPGEDNLVAGPRLLVDAGKYLGAEGALQVGVEHQIWRNKIGFDGVDEDVTQAMIKWIW